MPEAERPRAPGLDDMTYRQAFMIGCFSVWRCGRVSPVPGRPFQVGSDGGEPLRCFRVFVPAGGADMMGATALDLYKSWGFLTTGESRCLPLGLSPLLWWR